MTYVDGFVIPIQKAKVSRYKKDALWGKKMWMKHGALQYFECKGDDLKVKMGGLGFKKLCKLSPSETVMFSFIIFKNKAHRNAVNKKVMAEMKKAMTKAQMEKMQNEMPFDMKRFAYGGFATIVEG